MRRRPGPFLLAVDLSAQLNCVSRALEIRLGRHRSFLAPQNIPCPPSGEKTSPKRLTASVSPTPGPYLDAPKAVAIRTQLTRCALDKQKGHRVTAMPFVARL